jgi:hypothetical protein
MADVFYNASANKMSFGDYGFEILDSGTNTTGYRILVALEETELTFTNDLDGLIDTITIPAGFELYGVFSIVAIVSGKLIAYKAG